MWQWLLDVVKRTEDGIDEWLSDPDVAGNVAFVVVVLTVVLVCFLFLGDV